MSQSILSEDPKILPCPSCGQMIYSDSSKCRFCSADIDPVAAAAGAELQARVNNAVNLAKTTRHMAAAMWVLFLVGFIFGFARLGVVVLIFAVPISLILWQVKYGSLKSADPDFKRAKRDRLIAIALWLPAALLQLAFVALMFM